MRGDKKNSGFTVIELLVTTAIIIILSGLVIANSRGGESQLGLSRSANKLAQDIRRAQEMAMSAKQCGLCGNVVPPGYGIFIDKETPRQYILYADTEHPWQRYKAGDDIIETINLEKGVVICDIQKSAGSGPSKVSINFKPPDPKIKIKYPLGGGGDEDDRRVEIILGTDCTIPDNTKTVTANIVGLVDIE